ncbi:DegT/DnrJ/EryC1/StrS aminotransferase family protein [Azohydromonas lata]|uniref:DegT/DnrJ/EryC1/StrS family aminotransferase n=1 Tax=Azohydromonas lata TaxID=45677 RepID=A0ABU5IE11_9BURK|nr:DegT/DnrJ/EryC1/StrS family aminotransferase [Azohydromonas lata]MDZ5456900.1 DegT/DnrJ/EryC1/StrS family aminotransferase [Azohydromonas lata]
MTLQQEAARMPAAPENNEERYLNAVVKSRLLSGFPSGPFVQKLEECFCRYTGAEYAVAVNSGSAAIQSALVAAGVQPGDLVAVTTHTFVGTVNAIVLAGAKPHFLDIDKRTLQPSVSSLERALERGAKYYVPVHLYGMPATMHPGFPRERVIEDAAQGLGCFDGARHVGTLGAAGAFSLSPSKVVSAGEGGMVITNDAEIARKVRLIRNHGLLAWNDHHVQGFNFRLSEFNAAYGVAQFEQLEYFLEQRRAIADAYRAFFAETDFSRPIPEATARCSWVKFPVMIPPGFRLPPDELARQLRDRGVPFEMSYCGVHSFALFQQTVDEMDRSCPVADQCLPRVINFHTGPRLQAEQAASLVNELSGLLAPASDRS